MCVCVCVGSCLAAKVIIGKLICQLREGGWIIIKTNYRPVMNGGQIAAYQLLYSEKHLLIPPVDLPYIILGTPAVLECAAISHVYTPIHLLQTMKM